MTTYKYTNFAVSTLQAPIAVGDTSCVVATADASKFPSLSAGEAFRAVIYTDSQVPEIVECSSRVDNTLTIVRAKESTAAQEWPAGAKIAVTVTAEVFQTVQKTGGFMQLDNYLNEAKATDIASAATTSIGAIAGNFVHVTGTTTITSLGTAAQAGIRRIVKFDNVLTLTHNATTLILPNAGSNITTAAGDVATFVSESTSSWRCVVYQRANGQALQVASGTFTGTVGTTDNRLLRADGTGGTVIQGSAVTVDDSGNISGLNNITLSGLLIGAKGITIASASTVNLASATTNYIDISGTTTITSFGTVAAGQRFVLHFTGALIITHNAAAIVCPGGANLSVAAGDTIEVVSGGGGLWYVQAFTTAVALTMPSEFSVAGSPVNNSGTLAVTKATQAINKVFASPASGTADVPTFRTLTAADVGGASSDATKMLVGDMSWASRGIIGTAAASTGSVITCSTIIPLDDTIPQITEGTEVLTVSYTPKFSTSNLLVEAELFIYSSTGQEKIAALFRDSTANAIGANITQVSLTNQASFLGVSAVVVSSSTAATTFKLRVGGSSDTVYVNAAGGTTRAFGGVGACVLTVTEFI